MQGEAEPHPFPDTRSTGMTRTPRQPCSPAGCPARGCTDPALPLRGNAPRSPQGRCGPGRAPVCRANVAQLQVRSPRLSASLHLLLRFAFAGLAPSLPSPLARAHTTGSPVCTAQDRGGATGRQAGGWADAPSRAELPQGCPAWGAEVLPSLEPWPSDGQTGSPCQGAHCFSVICCKTRA